MSPRARLLVLCVGIVAGCATQPEIVPDNVTDTNPNSELPDDPILSEESDVITQSLTLIATATPESLELAILDLQFSAASETDRGVELQNVAIELFRILYPLLELPSVSPTSFSPASVYPGLFDAVRRGEYPQVDQASVNFLTLIIPALSVLFTDDEGVAERAFDALSQARSLDEATVIPDLLLAVIDERAGLFESAGEGFRAALAKSDQCYPAKMGLARIAIENGDADAALELVVDLRQEFPIDTADSIELLELAARTYILNDDTTRAGDLVSTALQLGPDTDVEVRLLLLRAQVNAAEGNYSTASNLLTVVERRRPDDADVLLLRMQLFAQEERFVEARDIAIRASALYPNDRRIRDAFGRLLVQAGDVEAGREILEESLGESPRNAENLRVLVDEALSSGQLSAAAGYLERLLAIEVRIDYLGIAIEVSVEVGDLVSAVAYAGRRYDADTSSIVSLKEYSELLIQVGRTDEASTLLARGIELATDSVDLSELYYLSSLIANNARDRSELLGEALRLNLQNVDALIAFSAYYEETGDRRKAIFYLRQAAQLRPEDPDIRTRLEDLGSPSGG